MCRIKTSLFTSIVMLLLPTWMQAQSYILNPGDSLMAVAQMNHGNVYNITQQHMGADTLHFVWKKWMLTVPSSWEVSICDVGHCYTSLVDSSAMDPVYPGDDGLISLHLNPHLEAGTGIIQVLFYEQHSMTQIDTLTWMITSAYPSDVENTVPSASCILYPNPCHTSLHFKGLPEGEHSYIIYDLCGNHVKQGVLNGGQASSDLSGLDPGSYWIQITTNSGQLIRNCFIIK